MKRIPQYTIILLLATIILSSCESSPVQGNTLTLYAVYESNADFFEIGKDIIVSTDKAFSHLLRMRSCIPDNEQDRYVYTFEWNEPVNSVFVKPPIIYIPVDIKMVSASISAGSTVMTSDGKPWFTITEVTVNDSNVGSYTVVIIFAPIAEDLPRFPEIVARERTFGGITQHNFDENNVFNLGEISFDVSAVDVNEVNAMLEEATLNISHALIRTQPESMVVTSNIDALEIIIDESD